RPRGTRPGRRGRRRRGARGRGRRGGRCVSCAACRGEGAPPTRPDSPPVPVLTPNPPAYDAAGLAVSLGEKPILHDLTFRVEPGAFVALLGPNGSGKTTLLRTLGGLLPYHGTLTLRGRPLRNWSDRARARAVAFVRQQPSLDFDFTVAEFVALGRGPHHGWLAAPSATDRQAVEAALAETDLAQLAGRPVSALSGGEQQRVLLAQALAQ